jgi:type IV fimbrial biogenesis protein FimT
MLISRRRQRGMSLIELMIGLALAALLLTLGLPSFTTAIRNREIRTAADAIQNGLQLARVEAVRRNRTVKFTLQSATGAWLVGCDPEDTTVVDGETVCPATLQTHTVQSTHASIGAVQTVQATGSPAGSPVFTDTLRFTALGRVNPDTLPAGNLATFQVTNPMGGTCAADGGEMRCLSVVVTSAGQVRMCDPAVTASTDPRKC